MRAVAVVGEIRGLFIYWDRCFFGVDITTVLSYTLYFLTVSTCMYCMYTLLLLTFVLVCHVTEP